MIYESEDRIKCFLSTSASKICKSVKFRLVPWCATTCDFSLTRTHRFIENFLKNLYELDKKDLQSQNSVIQLAQRLIRTLSTGVENVFRTVWR